MRKFIPVSLIFLISIFMINTTLSSAATFTDVSDNYSTEVNHIVEMGYANGINATQFGTDLSIKRIDAAVMVAYAMGFTPNSNAPSAGFSDVPKNRAWAVNALVQEGVINGKLDGKYGANDSMTRSEMAKVLANAYSLQASDAKIPFTDVSKTFLADVAALVEHGITNGKSATQFGANDNIKRGEFAIFIYRADGLSRIPPEVESVE